MIEKPLLKTLQKNHSSDNSKKEQISPPLWMMRQAGRYLPEYRQLREKAGSFWKLCLTPEYAAEITLQPIQRFNFDAAIIFSDILVIPQALGQTVNFLPNHGPLLENINWESFIKFANWESFSDNLIPTYKALSLTKENLPSQTTLIGFTGSPWTIATYMLDLGKSKDPTKKFIMSLKALETPEFITKIIKLLTKAVSIHLINQIKSGAEVVQIFDSWAQIVPDHLRLNILYNPLQEIVETVKSTYPNVPIIYFGKGVSSDYSALLKQIPTLCLGLDQQANILKAQKDLQPHTCLQGNLDPEILYEGGQPLIENIDHLLSTFAQGSYIFNLGHGILPQTPISHVEILVEKVRSYGS